MRLESYSRRQKFSSTWSTEIRECRSGLLGRKTMTFAWQTASRESRQREHGRSGTRWIWMSMIVWSTRPWIRWELLRRMWDGIPLRHFSDLEQRGQSQGSLSPGITLLRLGLRLHCFRVLSHSKGTKHTNIALYLMKL